MQVERATLTLTRLTMRSANQSIRAKNAPGSRGRQPTTNLVVLVHRFNEDLLDQVRSGVRVCDRVVSNSVESGHTHLADEMSRSKTSTW